MLPVFFNYLQFEKRCSLHTIEAYKGDLGQFESFVADRFEVSSPKEYTAAHVRAWMVSLYQLSLSPASINRKLSALKTYCKFLHKRQWIERNPMTKIIAPKVGKRLPKFLLEKEAEGLSAAMPRDESFASLRDQLIIELLYQCGLRRSELIGIRVYDIDRHQRLLKVLGKGNKERQLPLSDTLLAQLDQYIKVRDELFSESSHLELFLTNKGQPLYPKWVYNKVHRVLGTVSTVEQKSPHTLRHTFATHLSNNGANLNAIKDLLGHSSLASTQVYTHNTMERLLEVYKKAHPKGED